MSWIEDVPALARLKSTEGVESVWREIAGNIYSGRVLQGLPKYIERIAFAFYDVEAAQIPKAIRDGDVALFIAMIIRLDQIERAMTDAGHTSVGEHAPILYARHIVEGMRQAAENQLVAKGGAWPPTSAGSSSTG